MVSVDNIRPVPVCSQTFCKFLKSYNGLFLFLGSVKYGQFFTLIHFETTQGFFFQLFSFMRPKSTIFDSQKKPKRQENIESVISLRKQGVW